MRRILLLISFSIFLFSCAPFLPQYQIHYSEVDFTPATEAGFFLSESNSVSFLYNPVGSVSTYIKSGFEVLDEETIVIKDGGDDVYRGSKKNVKLGSYITAEAEDAISILIMKSKELGADGIINLRIEYSPPIHDKHGVQIFPSTYYVSGMAIKRT